MKKYRKKPVIIEAIQFNGYNPEEVRSFVGDKNCSIEYYNAAYQAGVSGIRVSILIHTLEGDMKVSPDDYIIKGVQGEFYPCKPDIFESTYEEVL